MRLALQWYRRAAEKGMTRAQFELGQIFDKGEGVRPDPLRVVRWYQLAIRQGRSVDATFEMGLMFYRGRGVLKDIREAIAWFRRAANQGHSCAKFLIGGVYEEGWAVKRDPVEAYKWYTIAIPGRATCIKMDHAYDAVAARDRLVKRLTEFDVKKAKSERSDGVSDKSLNYAAGAPLLTPISFKVFFIASTAFFMSSASSAPMQPMRNVSAMVSLPGYKTYPFFSISS